jgi:uroporphyrinogen-III synthase
MSALTCLTDSLRKIDLDPAALGGTANEILREMGIQAKFMCSDSSRGLLARLAAISAFDAAVAKNQELCDLQVSRWFDYLQ